MIRRIELENYMSHGRTVIEPADGLTVICGPNNCGKSAIVSAIETLCFNASGDYMVRHGAEQASVTIETDDGHVFVWRRKKGVVSYVVDGREVHRVQRSVPDDLREHLRLPKVTSERGEFDVHLGKQKQPIFLIDTESGAAAFFSTADDSERLIAIQRLHRQRVAEQRAVQKKLTSELEKLDLESIALAPLATIESEIDQVEREHVELLEAVARERGLSLVIEKLAEQSARVEYVAGQLRAFTSLEPPPMLEDEPPLATIIARFEKCQKAAATCGATCTALTDLDVPPELTDTAPLEGLLHRIGAAEAQRSGWTERMEAFAPLEEPPILEDAGPLALLVDRLNRAARASAAAAAKVVTLRSLQPPVEPSDPGPLALLVKRLTIAQHARTQIISELDSLAVELQQNRARIEVWVRENPLCPTCGSPISGDQLIGTEAHAHA